MQSAHSQDINNDNSGGRSSSSNLMNPGPASSSGACMSTSTNMQHQHDAGAAHNAMPHYNSNFTTLFPLLPSSSNNQTQWPSYNHHQQHQHQHLFPINFPPPPSFLHPQYQALLYQNQQQHLIPQQNPSALLDTTQNIPPFGEYVAF